MALGDQNDFLTRLRKLLPYSWFPTPAPILAGFLTGFAYIGQASYALMKYAKAQTRMATTSDAFLDIAAFDYCAARIQRRPGENDVSFRERIIEEVLRIRQTRQAIVIALMELTGRVPKISEPWNGSDAGFLDYTIALAGGAFAGVGFAASTSIPYTIFVDAYRPLPQSGLTVSDAEIYSMVNNTRASGIKAWVSISN